MCNDRLKGKLPLRMTHSLFDQSYMRDPPSPDGIVTQTSDLLSTPLSTSHRTTKVAEVQEHRRPMNKTSKIFTPSLKYKYRTEDKNKISQRLKLVYGWIFKRIDEYCIHNNSYDAPHFIGRVKDIDWSKQAQSRAGIIPYTFINGEIVMAMGIDSAFGDLTDFGGGVKRSDPTVLHSALREFNEETLGAFGTFSPEDLNDAFVVYDRNSMIIFVYDPNYFTQSNVIFNQRVKFIKDHEIARIVYMNKSYFNEVILGYRDLIVYTKVQNLLCSAFATYGDFVTRFLYSNHLEKSEQITPECLLK